MRPAAFALSGVALLLVAMLGAVLATARHYRAAALDLTGGYPGPVEPPLLGAAVVRFDDPGGWARYSTALDGAVRGAAGGQQRWPAGWLFPGHFAAAPAP